MAVTDTDITFWQDDFLTNDSNAPSDNAYIEGLLGAQIRNCKSVVRAESENKAWVRLGEVATYVSATSFTLSGDWRTVASVGRRVKATITGGSVYGTIITSSFASSTTTVTVQWDLVWFSTGALTVLSADELEVRDDDIPLFPVGARVLFTDTSNGAQFVRVVASAVDTGLDATITFTSGDPAIPLTTLTDGKAYIPSTGIDNTLSEVELGIFTPDAFESGMPHAFLAGQFQIVLDGGDGPFSVSFPVAMHDASSIVSLTPTGIVSGAPTTEDWKKAYVSAVSTTGFTVVFPTGATPNSGTVKYDWVLWRQA